jgi:hypothetical protein
MTRSALALSCVLAVLAVGGCFATREESLGEVVLDASVRADAAPAPVPDAGAPEDEVPIVDAAPPPPLEQDAGVMAIDLDAGHASDADAGHAGDSGRDARSECREPWEPWECR